MNKTSTIWYMAAGYLIPAGIEAHILHYATEMRNHGFDTKVLVFTPLPKERHRFLDALNERRIPVESLFEICCFRAWLRICLMAVPWFFYVLLIKQSCPDFGGFKRYVFGRESVRALEKKSREEQPGVIHIFGRLITNAWQVFPKDRTIFHEMMTGTVDEHWTDEELEEFRSFAETIVHYFAPGGGVAANVHREFGIKRDIDVIYTMAPDEAEKRRDFTEGNEGNEGQVDARSKRRLRFGILGRLVEQKGIEYLLQALLMFKKKYEDVDFTFAGYGDLEDEIESFIDLNDLKNVRIVKVTAPVDMLKDIDVFVHPSIDDAMPMSLVEALMSGIPCIASKVGGIPDLIRDGQEGFLIKPKSVEQILAGMERFAEMGGEEFDRYCMRSRARYEEKCTPEMVGGVLADHYESIINSI